MNKTLIEVLVVVVLASTLGGVVYFKKHTSTPPQPMCPTDAMMCPDGSSVPRSGPNCEFGVCKQELPSYMIPVTSPGETTTGVTSSPSTPSSSNGSSVSKPVPKNAFTKVTTTATSLIKKISNSIANGLDSIGKPFNQVAPSANKPNTTTNNKPAVDPNAINETRYNVVDGKIVDQNGKVIFTLPSSFSTPSGSFVDTHAVNAVAVNQVAPIIGAIPVTGLPGKYYLSVNSVGAPGACLFSNRIYILDINTGVQTLMYEENNTTIGTTDARSCTNEMYLLATEGSKLILKYHTIGTNNVCDSTWSEPENTWYLDVTALEKGTRRYYITGAQYGEAEGKEKQCRVQFESTSTPVQQGVAG